MKYHSRFSWSTFWGPGRGLRASLSRRSRCSQRQLETAPAASSKEAPVQLCPAISQRCSAELDGLPGQAQTCANGSPEDGVGALQCACMGWGRGMRFAPDKMLLLFFEKRPAGPVTPPTQEDVFRWSKDPLLGGEFCNQFKKIFGALSQEKKTGPNPQCGRKKGQGRGPSKPLAWGHPQGVQPLKNPWPQCHRPQNTPDCPALFACPDCRIPLVQPYLIFSPSGCGKGMPASPQGVPCFSSRVRNAVHTL